MFYNRSQQFFSIESQIENIFEFVGQRPLLQLFISVSKAAVDEMTIHEQIGMIVCQYNFAYEDGQWTKFDPWA